jgi:hypothetical protein
MLRAAVRPSRVAKLAPKTVTRGAHVEYGPEQTLFTRGRIIAATIASGFIGLQWYDNFYAKRSKEGKSRVGDKLIPSHPTREEVFAHEQEMTEIAMKRRQELQTLFSADNTRTNLEENIRTYPVPEVKGRSVPPGRVIDLEDLDERRPRTVYFKPKNSDSGSQ